MSEGDILGHEPMGIVEEVGSAVSHITAGDRVDPVIISCGSCWMCDQHRYARYGITTIDTREHDDISDALRG